MKRHATPSDAALVAEKVRRPSCVQKLLLMGQCAKSGYMDISHLSWHKEV